MGDPKIVKKKYATPPHPWQKTRIEEEKQLKKEYGLHNKTEIWKASSKVRGFSSQAKRLTVLRTAQSKKEQEQLLSRLCRLGLLSKGAGIDDILSLNVKAILERRLQTIVYKKGLARSAKQARQFIVHRHISVNSRIVTSPSYLVLASEESGISFVQSSSFSNEEHPERVVEKAKPQPKKPAKEGRDSGIEKKEGKKEEKPAHKAKESGKESSGDKK